MSTRRWLAALWPVVLALGWFGSFCAPAQAQDAPPEAVPVVSVVSGEHPGFSRLVLRLGGLRDWRLGRTAAGYELWLAGPMPRFDLTNAFDKIPRRRLTGLTVAPDTGHLLLAMGCDCHAMPFEYRPGIVVIDLRDGPAPPGSSFERGLDGLVPVDVHRPAPSPGGQVPDLRGLWLGRDPGGATGLPDLPVPDLHVPDLPVPDPALAPFRAALLQQFSRAASQGLVDLAPSLPRAKPVPPGPDMPMAHFQLGDGDAAPASLHTGRDTGRAETATGQPCLPDDRLDIASWGQDRDIPRQMADAWSQAVGEFDQPDPVAVTRLARFYLFMGFGAEVRLILRALPPQAGLPEAALWQAMSHALDGEMTDHGAFSGMLACPGAAALWAALEQPRLLPPDVDKAAVLRSFSALPAHLRRLLGPSLAERFLAGGDLETARALRDAILRAPGDAGPRTAILAARYDLATGDAPKATADLDRLATEGGAMGQEAILALIDAGAQTLHPLPPDRRLVAQALFREHRGAPDAGRFCRGAVLADALVGDFDAAFAALPDCAQNAADLWRLLAEMGPDSAVLTFGLSAQPPAHMPGDVARKMAERLMNLGFPDAALGFAPDAPVAQAAPADAPQDSAALRAARDSLTPAPPAAQAPLAEGRALLAQSADTRAALARLLETTPSP